MANVIAMPPVGLTGWELTRLDPISESFGLRGERYPSAWQRSRVAATGVIPGIGTQGANAGYVEMLKRQLDGGLNLLRVDCQSAVWHLTRAEADLQASLLEWTAGTVDLLWTAGAADLLWIDGLALSGTPGTAGGWPVVTVTGLPASRIICRPHELIRITDDSTGDVESARALRVTESDATGQAVIRLETALTLTGRVQIGVAESHVFRVDGALPRAVQTVGADWAYTFSLVEVFEDETDGFVEVDPWR